VAGEVETAFFRRFADMNLLMTQTIDDMVNQTKAINYEDGCETL
jgi:hypothetical protein